MNKKFILVYSYLIVVWTANIFDLIKGSPWFFNSIGQIIFWNFLGLLAITLIILDYENQIKELNSHKQ